MLTTAALPRTLVSRAPRALTLDDPGTWAVLDPLTPLWLVDGSAPALQQTTVRVCFDRNAMYVRFDCDDADIWGTYTQRDDPLFNEEVVEVFVAPGANDPVHYFEFEVSPNGTLFDATIYNPDSTRENLKWDAAWNCPGLKWQAQRNDVAQTWWAALAIPWSAITPDGRVPAVCRANFYRIERPRGGPDEYSGWSPTLTSPANFHMPARFGVLEFAD